jgi:hypothetical protein
MIVKLPPQKGGMSWNKDRACIVSGQRQTVAYDKDSVGHQECCITGRDVRCAETVTYAAGATSLRETQRKFLRSLSHKHGRWGSSAFKLRAEGQKIWGSIPGTYSSTACKPAYSGPRSLVPNGYGGYFEGRWMRWSGYVARMIQKYIQNSCRQTWRKETTGKI